MSIGTNPNIRNLLLHYRKYKQELQFLMFLLYMCATISFVCVNLLFFNIMYFFLNFLKCFDTTQIFIAVPYRYQSNALQLLLIKYKTILIFLFFFLSNGIYYFFLYIIKSHLCSSKCMFWSLLFGCPQSASSQKQGYVQSVPNCQSHCLTFGQIVL
jgi:hypothetical protein